MKHEKVYFYDNELEDEFSGIKRSTIVVDKSFRYQHGRVWCTAAWVLYHIIMMPIAFLYMKLKFSMRIVGREKLEKCRERCVFFYGNHTHIPGDGYIPACICFPKKAVILAHPDNVSLYGTKNLMEMLGAFPVPNRISGMKNFMNELNRKAENASPIFIYPEAHIWPYYTKIRPFTEKTFRYPALYDCPAYSFTTTYQRRFLRTRITIYIDGPFFPDMNITVRQAAHELRNQVYEAMTSRSRSSTYEKVKYIKRR